MMDLTGKRYCYYIPPDQDPSLHGGYVPAIVIADEWGFYPLSGDPEQFQTPWLWGMTLKGAEAIAKQRNERLGLTDKDVFEIIASSLRQSVRR